MTMELNFTLLVIAALAGMVAKSVVGWNPWKLLGSVASFLLHAFRAPQPSLLMGTNEL